MLIVVRPCKTQSTAEHDPRNRLFVRQNVRRLESEAIMNTMAWLRHGQRVSDSPKLAGVDHKVQFLQFDDVSDQARPPAIQ